MLSGEGNLASNCVRCLRGKDVARRRVSKCYFPSFLRAGVGGCSSAEAITCSVAGTVLPRANQLRNCSWSKLKPALQLFPGKNCSSSTLQPFAPGWLELIAVLLPAPAHSSPAGRPQSISPSKSHVLLPCKVRVTQLGGWGVGQGVSSPWVCSQLISAPRCWSGCVNVVLHISLC